MGILCAGMLVVARNLLSHVDTPAWNCSHRNCNKTALRAFSSSGFEKVSSLRLVFLFSSDDPGPWDTVAVEPSTSSGEGQDLAELEMLEALVSKATRRAARLSTTCSTFAILFVMVAADCVSDKILLSNLVNPCTSIVELMPDLPQSPKIFLRGWPRFSLQSNLRSEHHLSKSRAEEPKFEDNGVGEPGKAVCIASSNVRSLAMKMDGIHKKKESWVADTWIRRSKRNL